MVSLPSEFRARLDSYNGPLDLLLYLIRKDEIDIFDIPISEVVAQYHLYLEVLRNLSPNACGEFLVMAARLMEIKSKLLLPREVLDEEEDLEDPRIELVRQLLEYKKFKERAMLLERRLDLQRKRHRRPTIDMPALPEDDQAPLDLGRISVWDLLTAFHKIQISLGQRGPHQVVVEERPLEDYLRETVECLEGQQGRDVPFDELFAHARSRQEAIGYFLAILQLAKEYRLVIDQDPDGAIRVRLRTEEETRRLFELDQLPMEPEPPEKTLLRGEGEAARDEPVRVEDAPPVRSEAPPGDRTTGAPAEAEEPE